MIKIILDNGVPEPRYETEGAAGIDVRAEKLLALYKGDVPAEPAKLKILQEKFLEQGYIKLRSHERALFGTGIKIADMSSDIEIQVRNRSGQSLKKGLLVANSPGTVDSDYRGEIGIILVNSTPFLNKVERRDRIAQLVVAKIEKQPFLISEEVVETERGSGGFGFTGIK